MCGTDCGKWLGGGHGDEEGVSVNSCASWSDDSDVDDAHAADGHDARRRAPAGVRGQPALGAGEGGWNLIEETTLGMRYMGGGWGGGKWRCPSAALLRLNVWANVRGTLDFSIPLVLYPSDTLAVAQQQVPPSFLVPSSPSLPPFPHPPVLPSRTSLLWAQSDEHALRALLSAFSCGCPVPRPHVSPLRLTPQCASHNQQNQVMGHSSWRSPARIPCVPTYKHASAGGEEAGVVHGGTTLAWGTPGKGRARFAAARMYVSGRRVFLEDLVAGLCFPFVFPLFFLSFPFVFSLPEMRLSRRPCGGSLFLPGACRVGWLWICLCAFACVGFAP